MPDSATATTATAPALMQRLELLVEQLQSIARAAARGSLASELAQPGRAVNEPDAMTRAVHARLADVAIAQWQQTAQAGPEALRGAQRQALYAAVAVLDEALAIDIDWPGRALWPEQLLEQRLFKSRLAGLLFFEQAERTLRADAHAAIERELAAVYLLALQLGFKGMHRGAEGGHLITALRQRLHVFATGNAPMRAESRMFEQAYGHTLVTKRDERIAPLRPWRRAAVALVFLWAAGSAALWWALMQPLQRLSG